ncbi:response regulator transcription factor [Polynucleobacter sp. 86C-FISCH]|nr:response regulator transcription factor [Polynucleobacter sp. 86C-FISCH]
MLTKGLISKEIAEYLNLTPATVKVYKSRLFNKLSVKTISD